MQTKQHIARIALNAPQNNQEKVTVNTASQPQKFSYPLPLGLYIISAFAIFQSAITIIATAASGEFTFDFFIGVLMLSIGWGLLKRSKVAYIAAQVVLVLAILACMFVLGILVQESSFAIYGFSIISTAAPISSMRGLVVSVALMIGVFVWVMTYLRSPLIKSLFVNKA